MEWLKRAVIAELLLLMTAIVVIGLQRSIVNTVSTKTEEKELIKWVDFTPTYEALSYAYEADRDSYGEKNHVSWIELLAVTAAKTGGKYDRAGIKALNEVTKSALNGENIKPEGTSLKYYEYYHEVYQAVLGGMVGEFEIEEPNGENKKYQKKYGLKAFSPIAKGFDYQDYDDFGSSRSFGYRRRHLGHDMMGQIGTPIIAVESGTVEAIGWNRYGGWRIGIRSFDKKRYYYYAHMRQNYPYQSNLKEGSIVTAGDVIGYMGHTGYSDKENVNNIEVTHLHFGLQLIFDESQKESDNEIWIDCYAISRFLYRNRSETVKKEGTKEWERVYQMKDPTVLSNMGKNIAK